MLSRRLLALATIVLVTGCGARWGNASLPPSSMRLPQSPLSADVLYVALPRRNAIFAYRPGDKEPIRKITDGIHRPIALAQDRSGDLFVANFSGKGGWVSVYAPGSAKPVRKIANGLARTWSMAVAASGELFVASFYSSVIYEYAPGSQIIERKITKGVSYPAAVSVDDSGYLYVSNCEHCVAPVPYNTVTIYAPKHATLDNTIQTSYESSERVAFDNDDNAYVTDAASVDVYSGHGTKRIRTISGAGGDIVLDKSGTLYSAQMKYFYSGGSVLVYAPKAISPKYSITKGIYDPQALATDSAGNLYVANAAHNDIVMYAPASAKPAWTITVATGLSWPQSLAFDASGNLYSANSEGSTVTVYGPGSNEVLRTITSGIVTPEALAFDKDGNLYVADYNGNPQGITRGTNTGVITVYAPGASDPFRTIRKNVHGWNYSLGFDRSQNLYVAGGCNKYNDPIPVYAHGSGKLLRTITQGLLYPCAIVLDASGNLYVANFESNTVAIFPAGSSQPSSTITSGIDRPDALALDRSGNLYVTNASGGHNRQAGSITVYPPGQSEPSRTITQGLDSGVGPTGSVLGPKGELYVIDSAWRIVVYPKGGSTPDRTITKGLDGVTSLAFDKSGNLYVASCCSNTVTVYAAGTNKLIRTIPAVKGDPLALVFGPR